MTMTIAAAVAHPAVAMIGTMTAAARRVAAARNVSAMTGVGSRAMMTTAAAVVHPIGAMKMTMIAAGRAAGAMVAGSGIPKGMPKPLVAGPVDRAPRVMTTMMTGAGLRRVVARNVNATSVAVSQAMMTTAAAAARPIGATTMTMIAAGRAAGAMAAGSGIPKGIPKPLVVGLVDRVPRVMTTMMTGAGLRRVVARNVNATSVAASQATTTIAAAAARRAATMTKTIGVEAVGSGTPKDIRKRPVAAGIPDASG